MKISPHSLIRQLQMQTTHAEEKYRLGTRAQDAHGASLWAMLDALMTSQKLLLVLCLLLHHELISYNTFSNAFVTRLCRVSRSSKRR